MNGMTGRLDALEPGKALDALEREYPAGGPG